MATATIPELTIPPSEGVTAAEITSDEFFAMIDAGIFAERPVFLWDGRIYERMPKSIDHAMTCAVIQKVLGRRLPEDWLVWTENPLRITDHHAPLPDLLVVREPASRYRDERRHPGPEDVGLLIEVAVTSLPKDLGERAAKWALAGIPRYWVADVLGRRIVAHHDPRIDGGKARYEQVVAYSPGQDVPLLLDGHEVARLPVAELLR